MTDAAKQLADTRARILLVGAGQMGGAMLAGWLALGLDPGLVTILDPNPPANIRALIDAHALALNPDAVTPADLVILAVKPQMAGAVMPAVAGHARPGAVVVSVMAGTTVTRIAEAFGPDVAVIRTIPNTPAAIGRGMTGAFADPRVTPDQRRLAETLLAAVSRVEWLDREDWIDLVTAVSGSGPAYVFLLAEVMAEAGARLGLPADLAARLARATVEGAGELMHCSPDIEPATLRRNVTSPNGTTQAALTVLMGEDGIGRPFERALLAAANRSKELAG